MSRCSNELAIRLKPRYREWVERWLVVSIAMAVSNWLFQRITGAYLLPWKFILAWPFFSPVILAFNIWSERWRQPRRFAYWSEGDEAGCVVRHRRTRAVLLHVTGDQFTAEDLRGASLIQADLRDENLAEVQLPGICLRGADLRGARLPRANLEGADLRGCDLAGAALQWATLRDADLRGAQFGRIGLAYLRNADLKGACYNAATRWPQGFHPKHFECCYDPDADQALPIPSTPRNERVRELPLVAVEPAIGLVHGMRR